MKRCFDYQNEFDKYSVKVYYNKIEEESFTPRHPHKKIPFVSLLCPYCGIIISVEKKIILYKKNQCKFINSYKSIKYFGGKWI